MISVIVPVYNAGKYLHRCIDSILVQSFTDFELLLIDDGSKDNSGSICDEYAVKDSRIRVFHKDNGGVSSARNLGLDNAKGEWITFVDSDDWIEDCLLEVLYNKNDGYFSVCSYIYETTNKVAYERFDDDTIVVSSKNLTDILMTAGLMTPYCKLFSSKIISKAKIRFNNKISSAEDTLFVWTYILHIDRIPVSSKLAYHYCISGAGLSHKRIPIEESFYTLNCFYKLLLDLQKKYEGYDIRYRYLWLVYEKFVKMLKEEVCETVNYFQRRKKLKKVLENKSVKQLIQDKTVMSKGLKRKVYDYLADKSISVLVIYTYYYKYD